ncbi:hypothetical protein Sste5346_008189 [Sporothrix stenoceras]|uniref:Uncharacterized protein n=1 Tax=Sporothrix stenoceras TaxID=5173 RepID=A0ABR3YQC2_9PEZI
MVTLSKTAAAPADDLTLWLHKAFFSCLAGLLALKLMLSTGELLALALFFSAFKAAPDSDEDDNDDSLSILNLDESISSITRIGSANDSARDIVTFKKSPTIDMAFDFDEFRQTFNESLINLIEKIAYNEAKQSVHALALHRKHTSDRVLHLEYIGDEDSSDDQDDQEHSFMNEDSSMFIDDPEAYHSNANSSAVEAVANIDGNRADEHDDHIVAAYDTAVDEGMSMIAIGNILSRNLGTEIIDPPPVFDDSSDLTAQGPNIDEFEQSDRLINQSHDLDNSGDTDSEQSEDPAIFELTNFIGNFTIYDELEKLDEHVDNNAELKHDPAAAVDIGGPDFDNEEPSETAVDEEVAFYDEIPYYNELSVFDELPFNDQPSLYAEISTHEQHNVSEGPSFNDESTVNSQLSADNEHSDHHERTRENIFSADRMFDNIIEPTEAEHAAEEPTTEEPVEEKPAEKVLMPMPRPRFNLKYDIIDDDTSLESLGDKYRHKLPTILEDSDEDRAYSQSIRDAAGPAPTFAPILEMARMYSFSDDEYEEPTPKTPDISIESSNFDIKSSPQKAQPSPSPSPKKAEPAPASSPKAKTGLPKRSSTRTLKCSNAFWLPKLATTTTALTTSRETLPLGHELAPPTPPTTPILPVAKSFDDTPCEDGTAAAATGSTSQDYDYLLKQALEYSAEHATPDHTPGQTDKGKGKVVDEDANDKLEIPTVNMTHEDSMMEAWEIYSNGSNENLYDDNEVSRLYTRSNGARLQQCTWSLLDKPDVFGKSSGPVLMLTTPEGETKYPQDMKVYGGDFNWADDSEESVEE